MHKTFAKTLLFIFFLAFFFHLSSSQATAQQEFASKFTSTYSVSQEGVTQVSHQIELTNRLADVFASEYSLTIGSTRVKNVQVTSNSGSVASQVNTFKNQTNIQLKFTDPVVGKNKALRFTIHYINLDIATKSGRVLEVNIPKLSNLNELDEYNLVIKVPDKFDTPTILTPPTDSISFSAGQQIIRYQKKQITNRGVSILFGDHQVYDFTLRYTVKNPGIAPGKIDLAIPPDTAFQKVFYQTIQPQPENITVDPDGNWLAHYTVSPGSTLRVSTTGKAILYLKPVVFTPKPKSLDSYLVDQKFWPVSDPEIVELARRLKTPENIYNYIVDNLSYNYDRIDASTERLGAKAALNNPQNAICTEFTDLFVTLARAAGIPARSSDGFAFTSNSKLRPLSLKLDVLHAWPEYYDQNKQLWIPVDPTWGNTTGGLDYFSRWDLNHFTFAIHGQNSLTPLPAGAYKLASTQGKDVNVAFGLEEPKQVSDLRINITDTPTLSPLVTQVEITITNLGNTAVSQLPIEADASGYNIVANQPNQLNLLPPLASKTIKLRLKPKSLFSANGELKIKLAQQSYKHEIKNYTSPLAFTAKSLASLALGAAFAFLAQTTGSLLVSRFKK